MCKNFNGSHSDGSSFVNVNDCCLLQKLFVYHRYKSSFKKKIKESQHMVSHPETGSDSSIGSDRDRGRDTLTPIVLGCSSAYGMHVCQFQYSLITCKYVNMRIST